jgi:DNA invertase Pin-like site-specific DNA recombinase
MPKTRAVAYLRVSTDKQADKGVSLEAQLARVNAYAQLYELELVDVVIDAGVSAKTLDRPGLRRALEMLKARQAEALLVTNLDRLSRRVTHLGQLIDDYFTDGKWALLSVNESIDTRSAAGRLVLNVLASVSQWEREAIGERTRAAMRHKIAMGEFIGGELPYGFQLALDGVRLVENAEEQRVLGAARRMRGAGLSLRCVAHQLNAEGFRSRRGKQFTHAQVARMVG